MARSGKIKSESGEGKIHTCRESKVRSRAKEKWKEGEREEEREGIKRM